MQRETKSRVARSARGSRLVHEALALAVEQVPARAAQALLQDRAGHARVGAGQQAGGVELHHLHVAQWQPQPQRHGEAVHALVAGGRVVAVHGRPAAGGQQHCARRDEAEEAGAHVDHQRARQRLPIARGDQRHGAVLLQATDRPSPHLLHQAVDDLDAGEVALVHSAVEGLPGEGLAVQRAVGVAVEEAADLVFQLVHALDGLGDERPRHLLVGQPLAALDGVHEVALDGVARIERDVVAALHHARAAALADQALGGDGHLQRRIGPMRVQRREQSGTAGAEDEDVGVEPFEHGRRLTPIA